MEKGGIPMLCDIDTIDSHHEADIIVIAEQGNRMTKTGEGNRQVAYAGLGAAEWRLQWRRNIEFQGVRNETDIHAELGWSGLLRPSLADSIGTRC